MTETQNAPSFSSLSDLQAFLEAYDPESRMHFDLTRAIKRFIESENDKNIRENAKAEMLCFDYQLSDGGVTPAFAQTEEDGKAIWTYPSFTEFTPSIYRYIKERAKAVGNLQLKARYNQILWNSTVDDRSAKYANAAIDAYFCDLSSFKIVRGDKKKQWQQFENLKNGFILSLKTKFKVEEFKTLIKRWLFSTPALESDIKVFIIKFLLENTSLKKDFYIDMDLLIEKIGKSRARSTDSFSTQQLYQTGLRVAQKLNNDTRKWNEYIGDALFRFGKKRMNDDTAIVPLSMFEQAIPYYRLSRNDRKIKAAEKAYFKVKKHLNLTEVNIPFPTETQDILTAYNEEKTTLILQQPSEKIYGYLLMGNMVFPNKKQLVKLSQNKDSIEDFVNVIKFDRNKNISKGNSKSKNVSEKDVYSTYQLHLQCFGLPHLRKLFLDGIQLGKITFESLTGFISSKTWLGQELAETTSTGRVIKYTWLSLIGPSLYEYFIQTESVLKSGNPFSNYIMPIDSMTLKFEGALRDFAALIGVSTVVAGKKDQLREKYIHDLLADDKVKKYFDDDDLLFFNYLFVAKEGLDLRNNVAHAFYREQNYSFQIIHLLICAFLRLGKYKIK